MSSGPPLLPDPLDHGPKAARGCRFPFSRAARGQKGTEHLDQAARKSADQRQVNHSQRYIILPSSRLRPDCSLSAPSSPRVRDECILTRDPVPEPDSPTHILLPQPLAPPRPSSRHPGMSCPDATAALSSSTSADGCPSAAGPSTQPPATSSSSSSSSAAGQWAAGQESLMKKPPRGWLHADHQIAESGVAYNVKVRTAPFPVPLTDAARDEARHRCLELLSPACLPDCLSL